MISNDSGNYFGSKMVIKRWFESNFKWNLSQGWSNRISLLVYKDELQVIAGTCMNLNAFIVSISMWYSIIKIERDEKQMLK